MLVKSVEEDTRTQECAHSVSVGKKKNADRNVKIELVIKPLVFSVSEVSCDCMITETL